MTLIELAELTGVGYGLLRKRIVYRKWSVAQAVLTPVTVGRPVRAHPKAERAAYRKGTDHG